MSPSLEFFLEGDLYTVYFHCTGGKHDPRSFWDLQPKKVRQALLGTIQAYADTGKVPGKASGHPERWYHLQPPPDAPPFELFKFKDDPTIRFYSVVHHAEGEQKVVITHGFQDPKKGRQRDKRSETGRATKRAEEATLTYILLLRPQ